MKKLIFTFIAFLSLHFTVSSQAHYVFINFKDAQMPAIQNEYSFPEKTVSKAIDDKLMKMGYKGKESKGFTVYRSVVSPELGSQPHDLYFKVDRKSKKEKDNAVVNMLITSGNENFVSDSSDVTTINNAKIFLDNLMPAVAAFDLQQQISAQQEAVKNAERKYKNLQDDADDFQKKKKRIEQQIEDNQKDQKGQQAEIEKQRQLLEALRVRQK
jgi:hypothetical protein